VPAGGTIQRQHIGGCGVLPTMSDLDLPSLAAPRGLLPFLASLQARSSVSPRAATAVGRMGLAELPVESSPEIGIETPPNELQKPSRRPEYVFVNNIRFLAMVAIVYGHSNGIISNIGGAFGHLQYALFQSAKFGTIGFFLISGFLLGEGLSRYSPSVYFIRRVRGVFLPWIFWSTVWLLAMLPILRDNSRHLGFTRSPFGRAAYAYFSLVFIHSIYWFVPNFFLCLAVVLFLYKRVPQRVQGAAFLAASLFYGVNIYLGLVPKIHSSALFGFVFYLWLGMVAYRNRQRFQSWLDRVSWSVLLAWIAIAGLLALGEMHQLNSSGEGTNTLRISNQIYSVLAVCAIAKFRRPLMPRFINPRTETFGIYLLHPILSELWSAAPLKLPEFLRPDKNGFLALSLIFFTFTLVYLGSLWLTRKISASKKLKWMIGM
jgi:membrane-bound acyltransferase YfiQ involved in biofilm formation